MNVDKSKRPVLFFFLVILGGASYVKTSFKDIFLQFLITHTLSKMICY